MAIGLFNRAGVVSNSRSLGFRLKRGALRLHLAAVESHDVDFAAARRRWSSGRIGHMPRYFFILAYPDQEIGDPRGVIAPSDEAAIEAARK